MNIVDMYFFEIGQILLAGFCGFMIGLERQVHGSQAGVRTYSLVCIGSCLFGIVSTHAQGADFYKSIADPTRIAAQVVSGIGFLGAGVIFKDTSRVRGLTTAANIWFTASIGLAVSYRLFILSLFTSLLVVFILSLSHMKFFIRIKTILSLDHMKFMQRIREIFSSRSYDSKQSDDKINDF